MSLGLNEDLCATFPVAPSELVLKLIFEGKLSRPKTSRIHSREQIAGGFLLLTFDKNRTFVNRDRRGILGFYRAINIGSLNKTRKLISKIKSLLVIRPKNINRFFADNKFITKNIGAQIYFFDLAKLTNFLNECGIGSPRR